MKLLPDEYQAIHSLLDQYGHANEHLLVKKKGWLHIEIKGETFAFHRKDSTEIIEGKFINQLYYLIRIAGNQKSVESFNEVIKELEKWLAEKH